MARPSDYTSQDPHAKKARAEGYAARSVYKLQEIDRRHSVLRAGSRVLDLGAAPGSWSQWVAPRLGPKGVLVAVDWQPIDVVIPGAFILQADAFALDDAAFSEQIGGRAPPFDVVLSDMAPSTTGVPLADHVASIELCDRALELARRWLRPGGNFVVKVFQGEDEPAFRKRMKERFDRLQTIKPEATRARSVEVFLVGLGRR